MQPCFHHLYDRGIGAYAPKPMQEAVRWNIRVSKETDATLRAYLGSQRMKKGDLSNFIEDAVRWRVFQRTVQDIRTRNAGANPDEVQSIVDDAVRQVRAEHRSKLKIR